MHIDTIQKRPPAWCVVLVGQMRRMRFLERFAGLTTGALWHTGYVRA